jgi:hypothetical protein
MISKVKTISLYAERFAVLSKKARLEDRVNEAKSHIQEMIGCINDDSYYQATNIFLMLNEDISHDILLDFIRKRVEGDRFINFEKELSAIESRV